jgi:hypothetical protein
MARVMACVIERVLEPVMAIRIFKLASRHHFLCGSLTTKRGELPYRALTG